MYVIMQDTRIKPTIDVMNHINLINEEYKGEEKLTYMAFSGDNRNIIYLEGRNREHKIDISALEALSGVNKVIHNFNYENVIGLRSFKSTTDTVRIGEYKVGVSGSFSIFGGPCSIYSLEQAELAAPALKSAGVEIMRIGIDKERTSAASFQGLGSSSKEFSKAVDIAHDNGLAALGLALMDSSDAKNYVKAEVDVVQIGARYGQAYGMFKNAAPILAKYEIPVILKRNWAAKVSEWLGAAEYFAVCGVDVILCERGIRNPAAGFSSDVDWLGALSAAEQSHFPVIIDPCHATSNLPKIKAYSPIIKSLGFNGAMLEADSNPEKAWSDAKNTLDAVSELPELISKVRSAPRFPPAQILAFKENPHVCLL